MSNLESGNQQESVQDSLKRIRGTALGEIKKRWKETQDVEELRSLAASLREQYQAKMDEAQLSPENRKTAWGWWNGVVISGAENTGHKGALNGILGELAEADDDTAYRSYGAELQKLIAEEKAIIAPLISE